MSTTHRPLILLATPFVDRADGNRVHFATHFKFATRPATVLCGLPTDALSKRDLLFRDHGDVRCHACAEGLAVLLDAAGG